MAVIARGAKQAILRQNAKMDCRVAFGASQ